ncbi:MAG: acyltransferase family protein [Sedimentisphaeraceae bacterium JB056]
MNNTNNESQSDDRLESLDVLRGFDIFWIVGGGGLLTAIIHCLNIPSLNRILPHLEYSRWNGFTAWDLIFPLFIFISGVAMPFSFEKYIRNEQKTTLYLKVLKRAAILVVLGCIYNGLLQTLDFSSARYLSVLGLIGMAYFWSSIVVMNFKPAIQVSIAAIILISYYLILTYAHVPGYGAGVLTMEGNFASYIDRTIVPGRLLAGASDPEGLLMTFPASVLAIIGAVCGNFLKKDINPYKKITYIIAAATVCLITGLIWDKTFPINKRLWTSSFVVYASGYSLILMAIFYLVVDIWQIRKLFFPFLLIGLNPIAIYICAHKLIDFESMSRFLFGGLLIISPNQFEPIITAISILICELLFLYVLYRKKLAFKI